MNDKMLNRITVLLESGGFATWIAVDLATWNERLEFSLKLLSLISFILVIIINFDKVKKLFKGDESNSKAK